GARSARRSRAGSASPPASTRCCAVPEPALLNWRCMSRFDAARARLRLLFAPRAAESRTKEEMCFHIDMEPDRLVREERLSPEEARRRALAMFGGVTQHREELRDGR